LDGLFLFYSVYILTDIGVAHHRKALLVMVNAGLIRDQQYRTDPDTEIPMPD
jgi:hypothetical protein